MEPLDVHALKRRLGCSLSTAYRELARLRAAGATSTTTDPKPGARRRRARTVVFLPPLPSTPST